MIARMLTYNFLLMYGGGYWFTQFFFMIQGQKESPSFRGIFSTYSLEAFGFNFYLLLPTVSLIIAVYLWNTIRVKNKTMSIKNSAFDTDNK